MKHLASLEVPGFRMVSGKGKQMGKPACYNGFAEHLNESFIATAPGRTL